MDNTASGHGSLAAEGEAPKDATSHYYSETRLQQQQHARISTIPEGAISTDVEGRDKKSPPSPQSASATTGSSTTPTSIGTSGGGDSAQIKESGPEFPKHLGDSTSSTEKEESALIPSTSAGGPWPSQYGLPSQEVASRYSADHNTAALKILVSNNVAGSIIGRAGQTISELQSESQTRIKLSQSGDYYPGTQDRVCLVQGEPAAVKVALRLLVERLYLLQESQHAPAWQHQQGDLVPAFDFVVRLLVPLSCCGMIIGKSGSNIKFLEETTGVSSIRLSPKDEESLVATSERIVTITGSPMDSCLQCVYLVFNGMTSHPEISRYSNMTTSYASCMATASFSPGALPRQSQPLVMGPPTTMSPRHATTEVWEGLPGFAPFPARGDPTFPRRIASSPDLPGAISHLPMSPHRQEQDQQELRYSSPTVPDSLYSPVQVPQESNVGAPLGSQHQPLYLAPRHPQAGPPVLEGSRSQEGIGDLPYLQQQRHRHSPHAPSVAHSASAPNLLAVQLEQSLHLSSQPSPHTIPPSLPPPPPSSSSSPNEYSSAAFTPQTPIMIAPGCFNAQILIPDSMIGSVLGRGGQTLTELQMLSGTRIRISQRGEYMPGTRSRIVTIRGPTAQTVWQAQYMISQRIVLPPTAYGPPVSSQGSHTDPQASTTETTHSVTRGSGSTSNSPP